MAKKNKKEMKASELKSGDLVTTDKGQDLVVDKVLDNGTVMAWEPAEEPKERDWMVQDAARQMIKGYQAHWWPSIRKMANTLSLGERASESACRACFKQWGATLK